MSGLVWLLAGGVALLLAAVFGVSRRNFFPVYIFCVVVPAALALLAWFFVGPAPAAAG